MKLLAFLIFAALSIPTISTEYPRAVPPSERAHRSPTPTPTRTPRPTPTPTASPTATPTPSPTPIAYPFTIEQYGTAADGTPLHWNVYDPPATVGPWRIAMIIHGGGFVGGSPDVAHTPYPDLVAAGYLVVSIEYRLAPPGKIAGQVSNGMYPDATNDVKIAVAAAHAHATTLTANANGFVDGIGGSAGGYYVLYNIATATGSEKLDVGVCLSPATALYDSDSLQDGPFSSNAFAYAGTDTANLVAASPVTYMVDNTLSPIYVMASQNDFMPAPQFAIVVNKLDELGSPHLSLLRLNSNQHSWDYWPDVAASVVAFLANPDP